MRGHEKVNEGFQRVYDEPKRRCLFTLFSSGGTDNDDLPARLELPRRHADGAHDHAPRRRQPRSRRGRPTTRSYNDPERNAFFQRPPELRFGAVGFGLRLWGPSLMFERDGEPS